MSDNTYTNNYTTSDCTFASMAVAMKSAMSLRAEMAKLPEHIELHPTTEIALLNHPSVKQSIVTQPPELFGRSIMGMEMYRDCTMPPMSWREHFASGKKVMHYASGLVVRCDTDADAKARDA